MSSLIKLLIGAGLAALLVAPFLVQAASSHLNLDAGDNNGGEFKTIGRVSASQDNSVHSKSTDSAVSEPANKAVGNKKKATGRVVAKKTMKREGEDSSSSSPNVGSIVDALGKFIEEADEFVEGATSSLDLKRSANSSNKSKSFKNQLVEKLGGTMRASNDADPNGDEDDDDKRTDTKDPPKKSAESSATAKTFDYSTLMKALKDSGLVSGEGEYNGGARKFGKLSKF